MSKEPLPSAEFLERASEQIFAKLAEHPDDGVRTINAMVGPLPLDDPRVIKVARVLQAKSTAT